MSELRRLRRAWGLAEELLVVSARLRGEERGLAGRRARGRRHHRLGTFQKFFTQGELREWIDATSRSRTLRRRAGGLLRLP